MFGQFALADVAPRNPMLGLPWLRGEPCGFVQFIQKARVDTLWRDHRDRSVGDHIAELPGTAALQRVLVPFDPHWSLLKVAVAPFRASRLLVY
jgi:hypothetical protein